MTNQKITVSYRGNDEALEAHARNGAIVSTHAATLRGMINALKSLDAANRQAKERYGHRASAYIELGGVELRADDDLLNAPVAIEKFINGERELVDAPRYSMAQAKEALDLFQD